MTTSNLVCQFSQIKQQNTFPKWLLLPPLEMLKGLGIWTEHPNCSIPIFPNHINVPQIASELTELFKTNPFEVPGFLIENHGLTVWGKDIDEARNRLECFAYIFKYMCEGQAISKNPH